LDQEDDDLVPVFGSWRGIYAAVLAAAVAVMGLIAAFSAFPY